MGRLLAQVIPLALGAAVSPLVLLGAVAVMTGPSPLRRGCAFAAGVAAPLLVVTVLCVAFGRAVSLPDASAAVKGWTDIALGAVLIALGVWTLARPPKPPKPKKRPEGHGSGRFVAMGAAMMTTNVTTFALYIPAMKLIVESRVDDVEKALAIAIVLALTMTLVLVPLALVAAAPEASERVLASAGAWLTAHHRTITVALCFGFGAYLVVHGVARL